MKKIIFIHGFGVKKDARGMFTDIQTALLKDENLKNYKCIFTDLNIVDPATGNTHLNTLSKQSELIKKVYDKELENSDVVIIAHSQGCVVAAMSSFSEAKKIILLCPPTNNDLDRTINSFKERQGTEINLDGQSILTRSDGTKTFVPKEYWEERKNINYMDEFKKLSKQSPFFVFAKQDEIVDNLRMKDFEYVGKVLEIDGNHNFDGEYRVGLVECIKQILV